MKARIVDRNLGQTRACAGDIGGALRDIQSFLVLYQIFMKAELLALLKLKPKKCVLIPLVELDFKYVFHRVRAWLCENLPMCLSFVIALSGKY